MPLRSNATQRPSGDFTSLGFSLGSESGPVHAYVVRSQVQNFARATLNRIVRSPSSNVNSRKGSLYGSYVVSAASDSAAANRT